jgi:acetyl-CoA C-acetyltransferase
MLAPVERVREFTDSAARVLGIAQASDFVALDQKQDITTFPALRAAAHRAYGMARVGSAQIQFAELHDCFTIAEIIAMEDLGLVERGRGGFFAAEGGTRRDGKLPINLSGGLKSKGHPVGATGVAQICDVVKELRGGRELGLAQNLGGSGATCVVSILGNA